MNKKWSEMTLQEKLGSNIFGLRLAIGAVIVQAFHTGYVLMSLSSLEGILKYAHSGVAAILMSGAILFYTLRARTGLALFFAFIESAINIAYYIKYLYNTPEDDWMLLSIAIPISFILPTVLYYFSEEITKPEIITENINKEELIENIDSIHDRISTLDMKVENNNIMGKEIAMEVTQRDDKNRNYKILLKENI